MEAEKMAEAIDAVKAEQNKDAVAEAPEEIKLTEVEKLRIENIGLKQALLQEQLHATQALLGALGADIKNRVGAGEKDEIIFNPQNPNVVQLKKV